MLGNPCIIEPGSPPCIDHPRIQRTVDKGGQVLFVVPSLESKLFTDSLLRRWSSEDAAAEGLAGTRVAVPRPASQGMPSPTSSEMS